MIILELKDVLVAGYRVWYFGKGQLEIKSPGDYPGL